MLKHDCPPRKEKQRIEDDSSPPPPSLTELIESSFTFTTSVFEETFEHTRQMLAVIKDSVALLSLTM